MNEQYTIQIVLVLYKMKLEDSLSYQTLCENIPFLEMNYELIIYNNSPEITIQERPTYTLINANCNSMLETAYNFALKRAINYNRDWLLLLDQDTKLTKDYFKELGRFLKQNTQKDIAAAIPVCKKGKKFVSPRSYSPIIGLSWFCQPQKKPGLTYKCISAINSGSCLRVSALKEIGGFSQKYPLDALDHWYYYQFFKKHKSIFILDVELEQNLSLFAFKKNISKSRYQSILTAELCFNKEIGKIAVFAWKLRLFPRALKLALKKVNYSYVLTTFMFLFK